MAPASPFDAALGWRGLGRLASRYRVRFDRDMFARSGYLAGGDERRRRELVAAFEDDEASAILCARGGYGALRIVGDLPWSSLVSHPKWICGFSDVTALHLMATSVGIASLHSPNLTALGRSSLGDWSALTDVLERPSLLRRFELTPERAGLVRGPLVGGNLTLVHALACAGKLALPSGALLLLEDVTERPYRIDRMLTGLLLGGHLERVAGVVLGEFTECDAGPDRVQVEDVLRDRLSLLGVPIASGLPVGHGARNAPVVLGLDAELRVDSAGAVLLVGSDSH